MQKYSGIYNTYKEHSFLLNMNPPSPLSPKRMSAAPFAFDLDKSPLPSPLASSPEDTASSSSADDNDSSHNKTSNSSPPRSPRQASAYVRRSLILAESRGDKVPSQPSFRPSHLQQPPHNVLSGSMYLDTPRRVSLSTNGGNSSGGSNGSRHSSSGGGNRQRSLLARQATSTATNNGSGTPSSFGPISEEYSPSSTTTTGRSNSRQRTLSSVSDASSERSVETSSLTPSSSSTATINSNHSSTNITTTATNNRNNSRTTPTRSSNSNSGTSGTSGNDDEEDDEDRPRRSLSDSMHSQESRSNSPRLALGLAAGQRMRKTWQRDDTARQCTRCEALFSTFVRRHHCRCCGRIFCADCSKDCVEVPPDWRTSDYTGEVAAWPRYLATFLMNTITPSISGTERVCVTCRDDIALKLDQNVSKTLRWARCCSVADGLVDVVDLRIFMRVCKTWRTAANLLFSELRPLQYKLPTETYTMNEKKLLWGNRHILSKHTQWIVPLIRCVDWNDKRCAVEAEQMVGRMVQNGKEKDEQEKETTKNDNETINVDNHMYHYHRSAAVDHGGLSCGFVGCHTTMCSRTCQGWRIQSSTTPEENKSNLQTKTYQTMEVEDALKLLSCSSSNISRIQKQWNMKLRNIKHHLNEIDRWLMIVNEEDAVREMLQTSKGVSMSGSSKIRTTRRSRAPLRLRTRAWGIELGQYLERKSMETRKRYNTLLQKGPTKRNNKKRNNKKRNNKNRTKNMNTNNKQNSNETNMNEKDEDWNDLGYGQKEDDDEDDSNGTFMSKTCRQHVVNVLRSLYFNEDNTGIGCVNGIDGIDETPRSTRAFCYIPNLIYCLRFAPHDVNLSPLASLIIDICVYNNQYLSNQVYWCLNVAASHDPATKDILAALGGCNSIAGRTWQTLEECYQSLLHDVNFRIVQKLGGSVQQITRGDAIRRAQRMVDVLLQFSRHASEAERGTKRKNDQSNDSLAHLTSHLSASTTNNLSASKIQGFHLAHELQKRLLRSGVFLKPTIDLDSESKNQKDTNNNNINNNSSSSNNKTMKKEVDVVTGSNLNIISTSNPIECVDTTARIRILSSATMPMVVTFKHQSTTTTPTSTSTSSTSTSTSTSLSTDNSKMLIKSEDVRTDLIMLNCIRTMDLILKRELLEDLNLLSYNVLPTSPDTGIVEFVQNALTIEEIQRKYGSYIKYFEAMSRKEFKRNPTKLYSNILQEMRIRFMKSLAGYSVATFLLGVGDRHTKNMMVTENGTYFHIDFGYVLGEDPKPLQPPVRVTPMEEAALGGTIGSNLYDQFITLVCKIFNCVRHHLNLFTTMLLPLTMDGHLPIRDLSNGGQGGSILLSSSRNLSAVTTPTRGGETEKGNHLDGRVKKGAVDMSSVRFTRKYLLEQIRNKFEPGMADNEAEATMRQKVRREHYGATAETVGRLASDQTRQILQNTAPKVKESLINVASTVSETSKIVGGSIVGGVLYAGNWLSNAVQGVSTPTPSTTNGSQGASSNENGEKVKISSTSSDEWLDVSFKRE